jgi:hypothetical protein
MTKPGGEMHQNTLQQQFLDLEPSPKDGGRLELIVRRPQVGAREILDEGELDLVHGLVGDTWHQRASTRTDDGSAHPDMQLNIMNSRVAALVAGDRSRWSLAGDQLYLDLDLSESNLPPGTRLDFGTAIVEVTSEPHTGCQKFVSRFGLDAVRLVNSPEGRKLRLRGLNARVIQPGTIKVGQIVRKLPPSSTGAL